MDDEAFLRARLGDVFPAVDRIISRDIALKIGSRQRGPHQDDGQGGQDMCGREEGHRGTSAREAPMKLDTRYGPYQDNSSSSALASCRSAVSKPSVNQP